MKKLDIKTATRADRLVRGIIAEKIADAPVVMTSVWLMAVWLYEQNPTRIELIDLRSKLECKPVAPDAAAAIADLLQKIDYDIRFD